MGNPNNFYKNVSLQLLHQFPGQVFLRLEPYDNSSPVLMFQVRPGDIVSISRLADPAPDGGGRITSVDAEEYDDDFQPGDS